MVKRVRLSFVPGLEVEFIDRDKAIQQVVEWGEKSTWHPIVVFGPEGCGKLLGLNRQLRFLRRWASMLFT
jgi:predicted AAA+ superfamily ATPase